jgi:hypothetical protein
MGGRFLQMMCKSRFWRKAVCVLALGVMMGTSCPADAGVLSWTMKGAWKIGKSAAGLVDDVWRWSGKLKFWNWADDAAKTGSKTATAARSVSAGAKITRVASALSDAQIDDLIKLSVPEAGKVLGKMKLSMEILKDAYLRILVKRGVITSQYADDLWRNLGNVEGFVATMRKAGSANVAQQVGHLFELDLANQAAKKGFTVLELGKKFKDAAKTGLTDLDVFLEKAGKKIFIEAKNYTDVAWQSLTTFRADMDSLVEARKLMGDGRLCFVISSKPSDPAIVKALEATARQRGVELFYGNAESVIKSLL